MRSSRRILGVDAGLLVASVALIALSIFVLATAIVRPEGGIDLLFAERQLVFAVIGLGIAIGVSRVPIQFWERYWIHALVIAVGSLVLVRFVGTIVNGARRWIDLGPVSLQPSEFGKLLALIAIAGFLSTRSREIRESKVFVASLAMLALPAMIVFLQPDFGTAQVYGYLALGVLFFAGARWLHFGVLGASVVIVSVLVLAILPAIGIELLHDYQKQRLTGFLNPEADAQGSNYQTIQAKVAIGSGGINGRTAAEASQVQQGFLPEPQTDFIFATLTERHGFIGGAIVLGVYMFLLSRMLSIVGIAASPYGKIIAGGVATLFFSQLVINVGMVIGLLPVTGVPLPLFSYGGSALWTNMVLIGLLVAVTREAESPRVRYERRTGRTLTGFGSLRSTASGRERAATSRVGAPRAPLSPLQGASERSQQRRRRRARRRM